MDSYYLNQSTLPHYSSYGRQRGSGIGALVAGVGRVALPLARKYVLPLAKEVGREFIRETIPELTEIMFKKKSPKRAAKDIIKRTARKQFGKGVVKKRKTKRAKKKTKPNKRILKKTGGKRSRSDFFSRVQNVY